MRIAEHWVATTRGGARLLEPRLAGWLWQRLHHNFPDALSLVLMPDHLHLVVAGAGAGERLRRVLAAFTALFGVRFDVLPEDPANSRDIAGRKMRYGLLNPVRAGLVDDPWAWPWSTLRDLGGAAYPIWTSFAATAAVLGIPAKSMFAKLTTTADHRPVPPCRVPIVAASLEALECAVASTLRVPRSEVLATRLGRRLVVQASEAFAMPGTTKLASALGCSERTIQRARTPPHSALDAVLLCLGDDRLRRGPDSITPDCRAAQDWRSAR